MDKGQAIKKVKKFKGLIIAIALLAAFMLLSIAKNTGISEQNSSYDADLQNLLKRSVVTVDPQLASNLVPPTNQWFSSLVFAQEQTAQPVYAWPLALKPTKTGFLLSQPQIASTADSIGAPFTPNLEVTTGDKAEQKVTGYDDLSVQLEQVDIDGKATSVRLIRGSPFVFLSIGSGQTLSIKSLGGSVSEHATNQFTFQTGSLRYGLRASTSVKASFADAEIKLESGKKSAELTIFALPAGAETNDYFSAAANTVTSAEVKTEVKDKKLTTTYNLNTKNGKPTLFGLLSFMRGTDLSASQYGVFNTLEGEQALRSGNQFSAQSDLLEPQPELNLTKLNEVQRNEVKDSIRREAAALSFAKNDTYFAGKELYRAAQLLKLAKQLEENDAATTIQVKLKTELELWFDPKGYEKRAAKYFYYDNILKGVVGVQSSFGSEEFNDHHFHYGYFVDAASILGEYDKEFLDANRDFVNLLVKDVANTNKSSKNFPYMRPVDQYSGHSWASGYGRFDAGQNQESSSEAVHAWEALYRWGKVAQDSRLESSALALYNRELQAAQRSWLQVDKSQPGFENYKHAIIPLVWSGKLDYATFFDPSAEAKLAIQLIPLSPGSNYLANNKQAAVNLAAMYVETGSTVPAKFKDLLVMYESIADKSAAIGKLKSIADADIDGANSRSYMYAFIYSQ